MNFFLKHHGDSGLFEFLKDKLRLVSLIVLFFENLKLVTLSKLCIVLFFLKF